MFAPTTVLLLRVDQFGIGEAVAGFAIGVAGLGSVLLGADVPYSP